MVDYREILRLHAMKQSQRTIRSALRCSDHTIHSVLEEANRKGVHWPLDDDVTNADLEKLLFPNKYKNISMYVEPDYLYIHRELAKSGVTLTLLWEEYCRKCYEAGKTPYMSTQFGDKYRKCFSKCNQLRHHVSSLRKSKGICIMASIPPFSSCS